MKNCATDDLDLEAVIDILRDKRQPLAYAWEINGIDVAPEFTLKLYNRINKLIKTVIITPDVNKVLIWEEQAITFNDSIMFYSMTPTVELAATWIELKGKITSN